MKKLIYILLFFGLFLFCNKQQEQKQQPQAIDDGSPWIETIDNYKITTKSFSTAYETALESMSRMQSIEKKNLLEFIEKDINEVPDRFKSLNFQFQKKNFYDNYRQMLIIKSVADKKGFTTREDIKEILKQVEMQTLSTLYIQEEVEKRIKISDDQAMAECIRLRQTSKEVAALPMDRCLLVGRGNLKQAESEKILPKIMERIKEEVAIKHNDKFDFDQYVKNETQKTTPSNQTPPSTDTSKTTNDPIKKVETPQSNKK